MPHLRQSLDQSVCVTIRMEPRPRIKKYHQRSPRCLRGIQHGTQVQLSSLPLPPLLWLMHLESRAEAQLSDRVGQAPLVLPSHVQCQLWPFTRASQVTGEEKMSNMQKHRNREAGPGWGWGPDNGLTGLFVSRG